MRKQILDQLQKRDVNLSNQKLGSEEVEFICSQNCDHIIQIQLHRNLITTKAALSFQRAKWTNLTYINLYQNQIGAMGVKHLSKASFPALKTLVLSNNQIGNEGVLHLSKVQWRELQDIHLHNNDIGINGMHYIMQANWSFLQTIDIIYNKLTFEEMLNLVLKQSNSIKILFIQNNLLQSKLQPIKRVLKQKFQKIMFDYQ